MICEVENVAALSNDIGKTGEDLFAKFLELRTGSKHPIPLFSNKLPVENRSGYSRDLNLN
jgi:hypothetical protein